MASESNPAISNLRAAIDAIANGREVMLSPNDLCIVLHEAEQAEGLRHKIKTLEAGFRAMIRERNPDATEYDVDEAINVFCEKRDAA